MIGSIRLAVVALTLAAPAAGALAAQSGGPVVTVYRSWVEPDFTVVEGLVGIDPTELADPGCEYAVGISVRDAAKEIFQDSWQGQCPSVGGQFAPALETFRFALPRGADYTVEVTLTPKQRPEQRQVRSLEIEAFDARPPASDLVLARQVGLTDSVPDATLTRGGIGIRAASEMIVMPAEPQLSYYVEVYPRDGAPVSGAVSGLVMRADGRQLAEIPLQQLSAVTEPFPVAGAMSVAGLPPGSYRFDVRLNLGDTVVVRSHPFQVMGQAVAAGGAADFYRNLTDEQLEQFDAVRVWLTKAEADLFNGLSPAGKREFLARQFANELPTPDDNQESAIDAFLQRSQVVRDRYSEKVGRGNQPGYLTDRGRLYMMHGEPTNVIARPSPINGPPYEVWYYASTRRYVYLFADETRMRNYRLIYTNDPTEQGVSDWTRRVGPEAVHDIWSLGIRVEGMDLTDPPQ